MPQIITFTPNPALDITYTVDALQVGATHRVEDFVYRAGGKGLNTASVLAQMGYPARAVGFFSSPEYLSDLQKRTLERHGNFSFQALPMPFLNRQSVAIVAAGDATVFNEAGPNYGILTPAEVTQSWEQPWREALQLDWASPQAIVSINGSFAQGSPAGMLDRLIAGLHDLGCWVLVDTSGEYLLEAARAGADCLKPNVAELRGATGITELPAAARALLDLGARALLISAGKDGLAYVEHPGASARTALLQVEWAAPGMTLEGNPTGAGDAAVAGFLSARSENLPTHEALGRAVSWSAAAVPVAVAGAVQTEMVATIATKMTFRTEEWSA
ncbi:1-phosphofructokinase family hexose kinase [Mobiluncus curtisii]|uniref:1-phosphofructokinase family hexose kinase n=1 Tax=Mobiluncus curtisii TaxID=2051 RepID=UPI00147058CC|nr:PfkB family carbohydrate kinase [Mobiluncus curtisii]NMW82573.1 1-phosphofructokinase [Mobiluncus curtisii]NMW99388.1 1-phosphofructokinase [Mobiluncus curtisii]NMX05358.1 1-phosphofructokinase [Mobiluncus curtisii]